MVHEVDRRDGVSVDSNGLALYPLAWKDNLASLTNGRAIGANIPTWAVIQDGIYGWRFSASLMNEVWINFHINHDWAPDTDQFPHIHFQPSSDEVEGTVRWGIEYTIAKRDSVFPATTTIYLESVVPANSQGLHMVVEAAVADALSYTELEVDSIILCRVFRDAGHANDTYAGTVFGIFADLHYQADRDGTIAKASDFYVKQ